MSKKSLCKLDQVVDIIGKKWNLLIIWHLNDETLRFSELQSRMCNVNSKTITKHLRDLEHHGIIIRTVFPEVPPRVEYYLTDSGKDILPIINAMREWGGAYLPAE
jgi:DNA-binding HxlR family transcriptional regulator